MQYAVRLIFFISNFLSAQYIIDVKTTFQSRFGRQEWLQPYTSEILKKLPSDGIKKINIISPGFSADCLETLDRNIEYDYIFFSPPDYDELNLEPIKDNKKYFSWLKKVFSEFNPRKNIVTIVISDRRYKRKTIAKHLYVIKIMKNLGYE